MAKITLKVDPGTCILAANCTGMEPKLFHIGSESYVEIMDASGTVRGTEYTLEVPETEMEKLEDAVESCPTRAISLTRG